MWKFAPGRNASYWEDFHREGIISISFDGVVGDLRQYTDSMDLADRLGVEDPNSSNVVWNLESFRDACIGDIVVANRGRRTALGVGVIEGPYEYRADRNEYWHVRKTRWLISTELMFNKSMFRPDTFAPTLKWQEIKNRLLEGSDFQIGHSYLLRHRELTGVKLAQVWRFDIEPLLREYYFDAQEQLPRLRDLFFDGLDRA